MPAALLTHGLQRVFEPHGEVPICGVAVLVLLHLPCRKGALLLHRHLQDRGLRDATVRVEVGGDGAPEGDLHPTSSAPLAPAIIAGLRGEGVRLDEALPFHLHLAAVAHQALPLRAHVGVGGLAELHLPREALLHHPPSGVDGVAEEPVPGQLRADHAGDNRPCVQAHLVLHVLALELQELPRGGEEPVEEGVVAALLAQAHVVGQHAHASHILLTHGLDLGHAVLHADLVEARKLLVQEEQQLRGRALARVTVEVVDDKEEDGDVVDRLGDRILCVRQHRRDHVRRNHELQDGEHPLRRLGLLDVVLELRAVAALKHVLRVASDEEDAAQQNHPVHGLLNIVHGLAQHSAVRHGPPHKDAQDPCPNAVHVLDAGHHPRRDQYPRHEQLDASLALHRTVHVMVLLHHPGVLGAGAEIPQLLARHAEGRQALGGEVEKEPQDGGPKQALRWEVDTRYRRPQQDHGDEQVHPSRYPRTEVHAPRLRHGVDHHAHHTDRRHARHGPVRDPRVRGPRAPLVLENGVLEVHAPPLVHGLEVLLREAILGQLVPIAVAGMRVWAALAVVAFLRLIVHRHSVEATKDLLQDAVRPG
mmetsp:Transcript_80164/g.225019  ORF Transcript_80164/g.225019 Transcript_80164/m.225019 type:complete len:589 (-) Transcript_80164:302-2068(-)